MHEGDEPDALADLRDADALAREDMTEVDLPAAEADPAVVKGIRQLLPYLSLGLPQPWL